MLKMYHQHTASGGSPDFWEETWNETSFEEALRFCAVDPLRPLFERYAPQGSLMLEGGCGQGQYVVFNAGRGVRVVGLDFAPEALTRLRRRAPHVELCLGDVALLPFADESFDVYYSGGVVEHFEAGAHEALREARRVLKRSGVLLISVPYDSPLRRAVSFGRRDWRRVSGAAVDSAEERGARQFFQYAYTRREFERMLEGAGLRVLSTQGYSILWGVQEFPFAARAAGALNRRRAQEEGTPPVAESASATPESSGATRGEGESGAQRAAASGDASSASHVAATGATIGSQTLLRRLVISEDVSVPVAGLMVRALRWACANMMMYVCVRDDFRPEAEG